MIIFDMQESDLDLEKGATKKIEKSGCYVLEILKAKIVAGSNGSKSQGIKFLVKDEEEAVASFSIWHKNKQGEVVEFNKAMLSVLCYKNKINANKGFEVYMEGSDTYIKNFEGATAGVFLDIEEKEHQPTGNMYFSGDCKGFFDPSTKLTTSEERREEEEPKRYNYWAEKWKQPLAFAEGISVTQDTAGSDEFPF